MVLRVGIGLVIIWFGVSQIGDPSSWVSFLPSFMNKLPISEINFVYLNGWFELLAGIMLISGFYTRIVSFLLCLHLFGIIFSLGYNAVAVRDFGIFMALVSIFLDKENRYSLDEFLERRKVGESYGTPR